MVVRWVCFCVFAVVKFVCAQGRLAPQQQAFFGRGGIFLASPTIVWSRAPRATSPSIFWRGGIFLADPTFKTDDGNSQICPNCQIRSNL